MRAMKRSTSKRNGLHKKISRASVGISSSIRPLKKMNKKISLYMTKKPYKSATIATVVSGILLGLAYMKMRNRFHTIRFYRF